MLSHLVTVANSVGGRHTLGTFLTTVGLFAPSEVNSSVNLEAARISIEEVLHKRA